MRRSKSDLEGQDDERRMLMRRGLIAASVGIAIMAYPVVWVLGYQDHPWHLHTAADLMAATLVLAAAAVDGFGRAVTPRAPRWLTVSSLVITITAFGVALLWDALGRPTNADVIGSGVIVLPVIAMLAAWAAAALTSNAARAVASRRVASGRNAIGGWVICAGAVAIVLVVGVWAGIEIRNALQPPIGAVTLAEVTPPRTHLETMRLSCDRSVPGFTAIGRTDLSDSEIEAWYDDRFGPRDQVRTEYVARPDALSRTIVYDDVAILFGHQSIYVTAYETVSHDCLPRGVDLWDAAGNAWSYPGLCEVEVVEFWGISFGQVEADTPPSGWSTMDFPNSRTIAYTLDDGSTIYASTADDEWYRYSQDRVCGT